MSSSSPSDPVVNKRALARLLGVTVVSLGNWIEKWPDFPVLERGTNGREWRFDAAAVVDFLALKQEAGAAAQAERDEALAQLVLPLALHASEPDRPVAGTLKEQREALQLRMLQRQEAEKLGRLVAASDVRDAMTTAFATLNRSIGNAIKAIGHDHTLPAAVTRALHARIADAQRSAVREIANELAGADVAPVLDPMPERALA